MYALDLPFVGTFVTAKYGPGKERVERLAFGGCCWINGRRYVSMMTVRVFEEEVRVKDLGVGPHAK